MSITSGGILFSNQSYFDTINNLITIETRKWGIFRSTHVVRFRDVAKITTKYREGYDQDEGKKYYYTITLVDDNSSAIWGCHITDDYTLYTNILNALENLFRAIFEEKALDNNSTRCRSCNRLISKVSERCIYCGVIRSA